MLIDGPPWAVVLVFIAILVFAGTLVYLHKNDWHF